MNVLPTLQYVELIPPAQTGTETSSVNVIKDSPWSTEAVSVKKDTIYIPMKSQKCPTTTMALLAIRFFFVTDLNNFTYNLCHFGGIQIKRACYKLCYYILLWDSWGARTMTMIRLIRSGFLLCLETVHFFLRSQGNFTLDKPISILYITWL